MAYADLVADATEQLIFEEKFGVSLGIAKREGWHGALMLLELSELEESFKGLSKASRHDVISVLEQRLEESTRDTDILLAITGHRYLIWLQKVLVDQLDGIGERIKTQLEEPVTLLENTLKTRAILGISLYPFDGNNLDELVKHAQHALVQAHAGERDIQIYEPFQLET